MAFSLLPADDIFISYPRQGASTYASGLARELTRMGLRPFVDKLDAKPSPTLTEELRSKIRECKMLVVIGTRRAGSRPAIEDEIKEYLSTGRHAIVAIDFNNSVGKARWYPLIKGLSLEPEPRVLALKDGKPSESVLSRIETQFKYKRSKAVQRRNTALLAAASVFFTILSVVAAAYATNEVAVAKQAQKDAERYQGEAAAARDERNAAVSERNTAQGERDTANSERDTANSERDTANSERDTARSQADTAREEADKQTARARDAERARVVAQNEADRQNHIAKSRRLASAALTHLDDQLDLSLLLGAEAADEADTFEARRSLFSALNYSPYYTSFLFKSDDSEDIVDTSYSFDGSRVAAGISDGTVRVWDAETKQLVGHPLKQPNSDPLRTVTLSPDGRTVASGTCRITADESAEGGGITLWDVDKGSAKAPPLADESVGAYSLAFSPDGSYLAAFGCDGSISLWNLKEPKPTRHKLSGASFYLSMVPALLAFSRDGKLLASSGKDHLITIWDVENKKNSGYQLPVTPGNYATSIAFDPYGERLASGYRDGRAIVWYYKTPSPKGADDTDPCEKGTANTSAEGEQVVRPPDNKIVLCYPASANPEVLYHQIEAIGFYNKNNISVLSGGKELIYWGFPDLGAGPAESQPEDNAAQPPVYHYFLLKGHGGVFKSASFSSDYASYITGGNGNVVFWRTNNAMAAEASTANFSGVSGNPTSVAAHPDPGKHCMAVGSKSGQILFWDSSLGRECRPPLQTRQAPVVHLSYGRDGKELASVNDGGQVTVWDVENSLPIRTFDLPKQSVIDERPEPEYEPESEQEPDSEPKEKPRPVDPFPFAGKDVAFDARLKILATLSSVTRVINPVGEGSTLDKAGIELWDTRGNRLGRLGLEIGPQNLNGFNMAFNPAGNRLAVSNGDTLSLWDVSDPRNPRKLKEKETGGVTLGPLAFSHDGTLLAVAYNYGPFNIRSAETLEPKGRLIHMPDSRSPLLGPSALAFSPDDKTLAASGRVGEVAYFWDVGSQQFLGEIRTGNDTPIEGIAFSSDSKALATIFNRPKSSFLVLWKLDLASLKTAARRIANRSLKPEEEESTQ